MLQRCLGSVLGEVDGAVRGGQEIDFLCIIDMTINRDISQQSTQVTDLDLQ